MIQSSSSYSLVLLVLLVLVTVASASFLYVESEPQCGTVRCQKADYFHYYSCHHRTCDFHLQPWVFAIISFIVLSCLISLVCSLLNWICCSERRRY